jgi:hypothetical protein
MKTTATALYNEFLVFCGVYMEDMTFSRLNEFCMGQWPIVELAILNGGGIRACNSQAHDLTCSFVERKVFASAYE